MKNVVCIYSGGMDSYTMVNEAHRTGFLHSCLSFDYGQRHRKELRYATAVCLALGIEHHIIDLRSITKLLPGSALTSEVAVPSGHYAEDNMKRTVVPNRNMIMLAIASAHALSTGCAEVQFGAHAGDHTIYPDCRPTFIQALNWALELCDWESVRVHAPYIMLDKAEILQRGFKIDLNYKYTWTCYRGEELACGTCGSCQERLEAFDRLGRSDPLEYVTRDLIPKEQDNG